MQEGPNSGIAIINRRHRKSHIGGMFDVYMFNGSMNSNTSLPPGTWLG